MKIKTFFDYPHLPGFDQYQSSILGYNGITAENIKEMLPDLNKQYDIQNYLDSMEPICKGKEFVEFIKNNKDKKYCIIGDYDCDGIMATSILCYALVCIGIDCTFTIPDRFVSGYGMKREQIDIALINKCDVIITVDNGITANDAIDYAHEHGMTVIVTDHHTPQGENHADLCIDPLYNDEKFKGISGATVAMKLAYELYKEFNFDFILMEDFVAMACITVFSDVMPMLNENRIMVDAVLPYLDREVLVPGTFINRLAKLVDFYVPNRGTDPYLNLDGTFRKFNKDNIDFYFVPIINATNRVLGDVTDLVYDIMSLFVQEYNGIPHLYSGINKKRKFMRTELLRMYKPHPESNAIVEALHPSKFDDNYSGIAGLVASDVATSENKPALIGIDLDEPIIHFSGRSVGGFNLYGALEEIKNEHPELNFSFGGHAEALGAACTKEEIPLLEQYLSEKFTGVTVEEIEPTYFEMGDISFIKDAYVSLWPFGNKFVFPQFYVEDHIGFMNKDDRTFTFKKYGPYTPVKYFSNEVQNKLADYAFKHRDKKVKCIISFMEDENNQIMLKLEKIL